MSRAITTLNILLGVAIIALLASMATDRLMLRLDRALAPPVGRGARPSGMAVTRSEDLSFYAPILTSGLFGRASQGPLTPLAPAPAIRQGAAPTAPSDLLLLGTATGSFRETFALVRHTGRQEERVFRLGEQVFDAGRLVEVRSERAYIAVNGRKVELLTPLAPPAGAPPSEGGKRQAAGGVTATGATTGVIDQRALNAALDNVGQAMGDARLLPSQKDGRIEGFRVSEVKPSGVFAMLGIRNGDVLQRLNDFPIDSPDRALQSLVALKGQNQLKLDLIREGRPVTFSYDIR